MNTRALALAAAATSTLILPAAAFAAPQVTIAPSGPVVELSIYESIKSTPDQATISAGVTTDAPSASEALRRNAAEMTKVIARIKALGIAEADIQTSGISVSAQYDYNDGTSVFRGYRASNQVSVILRKIEDTGRILDALVEAGATDMSGPVFGIADATAVKAKARKAAVARGAAQAKAYAAMLGYADVRVLAVNESIAGGVPFWMDTKEAPPPAIEPSFAPVQPGQLETGVSLTITYELLGAGGAGTK